MNKYKLLNLSYLACFYYNLIEENSYNIGSYEDRKKANKNFANSKNFDIPKLKEAYKIYKDMLKEEFEALLANKTAKEK